MDAYSILMCMTSIWTHMETMWTAVHIEAYEKSMESTWNVYGLIVKSHAIHMGCIWSHMESRWGSYGCRSKEGMYIVSHGTCGLYTGSHAILMGSMWTVDALLELK
eukprot:3674042-Karenia_brevis.AAC.1